MKYKESETVELKSIFVENIKKDIIAFANGGGGLIYIGISNDGSVIGVQNTDIVMQQISNMIRDVIKPDITMFVNYDIEEIEQKNIIVINVQPGISKPYFIAKKGLRPNGIYVRQGTSSVPASDIAIRQMIKDSDGYNFEMMRSLNQELTFLDATNEFEIRNLPFGNSQKKTLKLLNEDGLYTNLAYILSDQCNYSIKVAVFQGKDQNIFKNRKEFLGSLFKQLNDVYDFIDLNNMVSSTYDKLLRVDKKSYPEIAIREALLNCLVHRDYSFSASTLISIYEDRIEFISIGGLYRIEIDDVMLGVSQCRNKNLANVFYRLQLIEAYGTGIRKIFNAYKDTGLKPYIEKSSNAFKIVLPNINVGSPVYEKLYLYSEEELILSHTDENGCITRKEVEDVLEVSESTASRLLYKMVNEGKLKKVGKARNTKYIKYNK